MADPPVVFINSGTTQVGDGRTDSLVTPICACKSSAYQTAYAVLLVAVQFTICVYVYVFVCPCVSGEYETDMMSLVSRNQNLFTY